MRQTEDLCVASSQKRESTSHGDVVATEDFNGISTGVMSAQLPHTPTFSVHFY
jgi:hypothetical protein